MGTRSKLIIGQINGKYDTKKAVNNVLRYIVRAKGGEPGEEIRYWGAFGVCGKSIGKAIKQFIQIQETAGKASGMRLRHFFISLPGYVDDANIARIIAAAVSEFIYTEYQVVYGVHEKEGNLHIHFAFNPVSYVTHKKWHMSSKEFQEWKEKLAGIVNECLVEYGYKKCEL